MNYCTLFTIPRKLNNFIKSGKDILNKMSRCDVVYKIDCLDCESTYVRQTKRQLGIRVKRILKQSSNLRSHQRSRVNMFLYIIILISHATYDTHSHTFMSIFV